MLFFPCMYVRCGLPTVVLWYEGDECSWRGIWVLLEDFQYSELCGRIVSNSINADTVDSLC